MNIIIDKDFKEMFPPLHKEEYSLLEQSIIKDGCREPLTLWGKILIDGHNRYNICQKHNIPYRTSIMDFESRDEVVVWMIHTQIGRRNLSEAQRIELAILSESMIREKAKRRMVSGKTHDPVQKTSQGHVGKTREQVAKLAGVSHDTVKKYKDIKENAPPELLSDVMSGKKKIGTAHREIQEQHTSKLELARERKTTSADSESDEYIHCLDLKRRFRNAIIPAATLRIQEGDTERWKSVIGTHSDIDIEIQNIDMAIESLKELRKMCCSMKTLTIL